METVKGCHGELTWEALADGKIIVFRVDNR